MLSSSPTLFAANHVLRRLLPPRHPPSALCSLTINRAGRLPITRSAFSASHVREAGTDHEDRFRRHVFFRYILQARRSQLGKIFSYQGSTDRKIRSLSPVGGERVSRTPFDSTRVTLGITPLFTRQIIWDLVELDGIEPTTSGLQSPRSPN